MNTVTSDLSFFLRQGTAMLLDLTKFMLDSKIDIHSYKLSTILDIFGSIINRKSVLMDRLISSSTNISGMKFAQTDESSKIH